MQIRDGQHLFSASDRGGFLNCEYLSALELLASVIVSATSQRPLLVTPSRSVTHVRCVLVLGAERRRDRLHRGVV